MPSHAASIQSIEHRDRVVGDIPHHLAIVGDGGAVGEGAGCSHSLAGHPIGPVVEIVEVIADGMPVLAVPQQVATVQAGGSQHGGGGAAALGNLVVLAPTGGDVHGLEKYVPGAAAPHSIVVVSHHVAVAGFR